MDFFSPTGLLPVACITVIALFSANFFVRNLSTTDNHEFASIDGLRGFLALTVFIHHALYWFNYSKDLGWVNSSTNLFMNFGHASVSLFFMLTGFLFSLKLIDARNKEIDWLKLYCSRFMRLTPLYLFLMVAMFFIVFSETHFTLYEPLETVRTEIWYWLLFVIPGHPDINTFPNTHLLTAGVIWTLPYEWYFYFLLPVLAIFVGAKSKANSGIWLLLSSICVIFFSAWQLNIDLFYAFGSGGLAAAIVRTPSLRQHFCGPQASWIALACFVIGYSCFAGNINFPRQVVLTTGLIFVACGTSIFGLLTMRSVRALSTISYGVYLLHGILLFISFHYVVPTETRLHLDMRHYWYFLFLFTPVLIAASTLSWYLIELPAINAAPRLSRWISTRLHPTQPAPIATEPARSEQSTQTKQTATLGQGE